MLEVFCSTHQVQGIESAPAYTLVYIHVYMMERLSNLVFQK